MKYRKITATKSGLGKYHSLWMGEDHLLAVESTGYSEDYSRYYFKDIEALVSRRTARGKIINAAFGMLTAICLLAALGTAFADRSWLVAAGFFLLLLFANLFLGPTCRCHLYTSIGSSELPTICRFRTLKKLVDRLHPAIALSQGEIDRRQVVALTAAAQTGPSPAAEVAPPKIPSFPARPDISAPDTAKPHLGAFLFLILHAFVVVLWRLYGTDLLLWLTVGTSLLFFGAAIVALVRQQEHPVAPLAKWMTWGGIAALSAGSVGGYFFTLFLNMQRMGQTKPGSFNQFDLYKGISPAGHPAFSAFLLVYAALATAVAVTGLLSLRARPLQSVGRRP
jgi:hypothetical protein